MPLNTFSIQFTIHWLISKSWWFLWYRHPSVLPMFSIKTMKDWLACNLKRLYLAFVIYRTQKMLLSKLLLLHLPWSLFNSFAFSFKNVKISTIIISAFKIFYLFMFCSEVNFNRWRLNEFIFPVSYENAERAFVGNHFVQSIWTKLPTHINIVLRLFDTLATGQLSINEDIFWITFTE